MAAGSLGAEGLAESRRAPGLGDCTPGRPQTVAKKGRCRTHRIKTQPRRRADGSSVMNGMRLAEGTAARLAGRTGNSRWEGARQKTQNES